MLIVGDVCFTLQLNISMSNEILAFVVLFWCVTPFGKEILKK